jgi:hypothetical protein
MRRFSFMILIVGLLGLAVVPAAAATVTQTHDKVRHDVFTFERVSGC